MNQRKKHSDIAENPVIINAKPYDELKFTDDFLFCRILQNDAGLCRELVSLILGKTVRQPLHAEPQKAIEITADGRGVRFDVYLEDDEDTVYDIEMQVILHRYTFRNICEEKPELYLDDGACKVILCAEGTEDDVSDELAAFLRYLAKQ